MSKTSQQKISEMVEGLLGSYEEHPIICNIDSENQINRDVILEIDVQGALQLAQKRPEAILIFIAPPSWEELEHRLTLRGTDSPEKIQKRLLRAKVECRTASAYHYFVINDTIENAAQELDAIMTAEHCRSIDRMEIIRDQ